MKKILFAALLLPVASIAQVANSRDVQRAYTVPMNGVTNALQRMNENNYRQQELDLQREALELDRERQASSQQQAGNFSNPYGSEGDRAFKLVHDDKSFVDPYLLYLLSNRSHSQLLTGLERAEWKFHSSTDTSEMYYYASGPDVTPANAFVTFYIGFDKRVPGQSSNGRVRSVSYGSDNYWTPRAYEIMMKDLRLQKTQEVGRYEEGVVMKVYSNSAFTIIETDIKHQASGKWMYLYTINN